MTPRFFRTLNYSSVNEDWRTELAALRLQPEDRVLCVTGSGDRPLDLLAAAPAAVVAIDRNPAQQALLHLKVAALRELPFGDYTRFLGLREAPGAWRDAVLARLAPGLPPGASAFWHAHPGLVRRGAIYGGRFERHMRRLARLARLVRPRAVPALFAFTDLDAQRRFVAETWDRPAWRLLVRAMLSPVASRIALRDPAYYAHAQVPVGQTIHRRMRRALERHLARENFMVGLALAGRLPDGDLPPYLTQHGCERIRARLERLTVEDADLLEYLTQTAPRSFTRFSLSDVPSYLTAAGFRHLLGGVVRCAAPRARLVVRQFLTRYDLPADLAAAITREPDLERRLAAEDRAFVYEFLIATLAPDLPA